MVAFKIGAKMKIVQFQLLLVPRFPDSNLKLSCKMLFNWTGEETALLLRVVMEHKISKMEGGSDWETVKQK